MLAGLREAQLLLARTVTTMIHGAEAAQAAIDVSTLLFAKGDPAMLSADALEALAREVPTAALPPSESYDTLALFVSAGLCASKGEARRLHGCLGELGARDAVLIRTAFLEGATYPELAERSGEPLGTIKSRIRRALMKLRECLCR